MLNSDSSISPEEPRRSVNVVNLKKLQALPSWSDALREAGEKFSCAKKELCPAPLGLIQFFAVVQFFVTQFFVIQFFGACHGGGMR